MALAACGQAPSETTPVDNTPEMIELEGVWQATGPGTYGLPTTYTFSAEASGTAMKVSVTSASGVKRCQDVPYALLADGTLQLDGTAFTIAEADAGRIVLEWSTGDAWATLESVEGDPPVTPCTEISARIVDASNRSLFQDSKLDLIDCDPIYTSDVPGQPVLRHDVATESTTVAAELGVPYRSVVAVVDQDSWFVVDFAGHLDHLGLYDAATDTLALAMFEVRTQAGDEIRIRAAHYDPRARELLLLVVVTRDGNENLLQTYAFNPTATTPTLTLNDEKPFLPGTTVFDLAMSNHELLVLTDRSTVVRVGDDGLARDTILLRGTGGWPTGIAAAGPTIYVVAVSSGDAWLSSFTLP